MKKILTLLMLVSSLQVFSQTIYYVKTTGNDVNNGATWTTAFKTIQRALDVIISGEIWVAAGTYYPDEGGGKTDNDKLAYFSMRNGVALYGGFAGTETARSQRNWISHPTILSGDIDHDGSHNNNSYHVVFSKDDNYTAILDGFTITQGHATDNYTNGGGMRCDQSAPKIENCIFTNNSAHGYGAAMYNNDSNPTMINCRFTNNSTFFWSEWVSYGGAIYNNYSSIKLANCLFDGNHATNGTAIYNDHSSPDILSCTFYGNSDNGLGYNTASAIKNNHDSHPNIVNSILWANGDDEIDNEHYSYGNVSYSIVKGGYSGSTNINQDPMFLSTSNFHLKGCSPAINTGTAIGSPAIDLDRAPRPALGGYDMGAYEFQPGGSGTVLYVKSNATGVGNGTSWTDAFTKLQDALARATSCYSPTQVWVAAGTYYPDEGVGLINNSRNLSFNLKNNTALYGGFTGSETNVNNRDWRTNITILSGDIDQLTGNTNNSYQVVKATSVNNSAILDGFTIKGGNAGGYNGGGLYINAATPAINHCTFDGNAADNGGGIYIKACSPSINLSTVRNNTATYGAGIFVESTSLAPANASPLINGVSFMSNTASAGAAGIYNYYSSGTIVNCSFWGNNAPQGSSMLNNYTDNLRLINNSFAVNTASGTGGTIYNWNLYTQPIIINSILWANTGGQIAQDRATVSSSIVQGGYAGGTNIFTMDPVFKNLGTGDLHLQQSSPAIDTGDNAAISGIPLDGDGTGRLVGDKVDLGAYEWHQAAGPGGGETYPLNLKCYGDYTVDIEPGSCGYLLNSYNYVIMGGVKPITLSFDPAANTLLGLGDHIITISVSDSTGETQSCSYIITVQDTIPPVINCGATNLLTRSAGSNCTYVINNGELDIQVSDNCNIPAVKYYRLSGATTSDFAWFDTLDGITLNLGETTIDYEAFDAAGNEVSCSRVVQVNDNSAPTITHLSVDKPILYPPNHLMQDISVAYTVSDCSGVTTTLAISSNEATSINGAGNTSTDWQVVDNHHIKLRAERSGTGSDRIYTITVNSMDAAGHTASATTKVTVPHDNKAPVTVRARVADAKAITGLVVTAAPNPFNNGFNLSVQSPSSQLFSIRVLDAAGRLIESRTSLSPGAINYLGQTYSPGVYHVQVTQGAEMQSVKIVKQ